MIGKPKIRQTMGKAMELWRAKLRCNSEKEIIAELEGIIAEQQQRIGELELENADLKSQLDDES